MERDRLPAYTGRPDAIGRFNAGVAMRCDLGCGQGVCGCRTRDERPMSIETVDLKTVRILLSLSRFLSGMIRLSHHNTVTGGTTHGRCTVHRAAVPSDGVPGFHEPDA